MSDFAVEYLFDDHDVVVEDAVDAAAVVVADVVGVEYLGGKAIDFFWPEKCPEMRSQNWSEMAFEK